MSEALISELDVFSSHPFLLAVEDYEDLLIAPTNSIENGNSLAEFSCPGFSDKMKMLHEIYLSCTIQILKDDDEKYKKTDELQGYVCNGILTSLFRTAQVYLNNQLVTSTNDNFGIQEFIQLSLNFSPSVTSSKLCNQGFYSAGETTKLKDLVKGSQVVELMGKLNLINTDKLLIPNVALDVKLGFHSPDFFICEASNTGGTSTSKSKLVVKDLKLHIRHVKMRENYLIRMEQTLAKGLNAIYEWKYPIITTCTIPTGQNSFSVNSLYRGVKGSFVLIAFMKNTQYVGERSSDPMLFKNHDLSRFNFIVNGVDKPPQPFTFSKSDDEAKYGRLFHSLYSALGIMHENVAINVDRDNYPDKLFFIAQDISGFGSALTSLNELLENVSIGFNATFSKALTHPLVAIMYVLLPKRMEITAKREIITRY